MKNPRSLNGDFLCRRCLYVGAIHESPVAGGHGDPPLRYHLGWVRRGASTEVVPLCRFATFPPPRGGIYIGRPFCVGNDTIEVMCKPANNPSVTAMPCHLPLHKGGKRKTVCHKSCTLKDSNLKGRNDFSFLPFVIRF